MFTQIAAPLGIVEITGVVLSIKDNLVTLSPL